MLACCIAFLGAVAAESCIQFTIDEIELSFPSDGESERDTRGFEIDEEDKLPVFARVIFRTIAESNIQNQHKVDLIGALIVRNLTPPPEFI